MAVEKERIKQVKEEIAEYYERTNNEPIKCVTLKQYGRWHRQKGTIVLHNHYCLP